MSSGELAYAISLLGPTRVRAATGEVNLRPSLRRSLLELLALRPAEAVPLGLIVEELWSGAAPERPAQAIQAHVRRLRAMLVRDGVPAQALPVRLTGGGFLLDVSPESVDAVHMVELVNEAAGLPADSALAAIPLLERALALWAGEPFGGIVDGVRHRSAARYWEEVRLLAVRSWAAAQLRVGRPHRVITRFHADGLAGSIDEGLIALLISALHRVGRKVDALEAYRSFRGRLVEEFGVEPSADLQQFHQLILLDDRNANTTAAPLLDSIGGC
ncbi:AfsR/SARP family transcriptional regulator [Amycolatopsis magusensis]|uniref:AfsR/SARP family transcriptional regulator n=1 Tax=Amycolatopsis magusensis TaxID=882444 RepID=UPI003C2BE2C3